MGEYQVYSNKLVEIGCNTYFFFLPKQTLVGSNSNHPSNLIQFWFICLVVENLIIVSFVLFWYFDISKSSETLSMWFGYLTNQTKHHFNRSRSDEPSCPIPPTSGLAFWLSPPLGLWPAYIRHTFYPVLSSRESCSRTCCLSSEV